MFFPDHSMGRRQLFRNGLTIAAAIAAGGIWLEQQKNVPDTVRNYRKHIGQRAVTFEEASGLVLPLSEVFAQSPGSQHDPQDIASRTFIIRADFNNPAEADQIRDQIYASQGHISDDPLTSSLESDYPNLHLTSLEKGNLLRKIGTNNRGCVVDNRAYVMLNRVNQTSGSIIHPSTGELIPRYQYQGFGHKVDCEPVFPITQFTSTTLHEIKHLDDLTDGKPLEDEIIRSYQRVEDKLFTRYPNVRNIRNKGIKRNFVVDFTYSDGKLGFSSLLDEVLADQTMAAVSQKVGIPYTLSYTTPLELANFQSVLDQANISQSELRRLHQQADIVEFFLKISRGARNINFQSREDQLDFGVQRFLYRPGGIPNTQIIIWQDFSPYFSGIDTTGENGFDKDQLRLPMFHSGEESLEYYDQKFRASCY